MAVLRLFAQAREVAGASTSTIPGGTVDEVLEQAKRDFGESFSVILAGSKVWLNGSPAQGSEPVTDRDEVAVLPPVSGG